MTRKLLTTIALFLFTGFAFFLAVLTRPQEVFAVPKISGIQLTDGNTSSPPMTVITDNITPYTIIVGFIVDDVNTTQDISSMDTVSAAINYGGENAGQYRGYVTWSSTDKWPSYQDHKTCTTNTRSAGLIPTPGYAVIQPTWGNNYLHLDSCVVSVPVRMLRPEICQPVPWDPCPPRPQYLVNLTVRFTPAFTSPSDNDISANATRTDGATTGWATAQTDFNVASCPGTVSVMGQLNRTPPSGTQICASGGSCVSPASNSYSVPTPAYSNATITAIPPPNWTVSPTSGSVTTTCVNNRNGPFFAFTQSTTCPSNVTVSGSAVNAPNGSQVCYGSTCSNTNGNNYSLSVPSNSTVNLTATAPTGYTVSPTSASVTTICSNMTGGPTFTWTAATYPTTITGNIVNQPAGQTVQCCTNTNVCSTATNGSYSLTVPQSTDGTNPATYTITCTPNTMIPSSYNLTVSLLPSTRGPSSWFLSDAGNNFAGSTINAGSGNYSEGGIQKSSPAGYNSRNYSSFPPLTNVSYNYLLATTLRNVGTTPSAIDSFCAASCPNGGACSGFTTKTNLFVVPQVTADIYCYTASGNNFDYQYQAALASPPSSNFKILYPYNITGQTQVISTNKIFP